VYGYTPRRDHQGHEGLRKYHNGPTKCWSDGVMIFSKLSTPILHHSNTPWFWYLRTTILESLRGLGEFSKIRNISDSDIPPAKAPRTLSSDKYFFFFFAAFASLREIIRNSVAASPRWVLRGELISVFAVTMVLGLSGCMVGPDYQRPSVEIPPQFRAAMPPEAWPAR